MSIFGNRSRIGDRLKNILKSRRKKVKSTISNNIEFEDSKIIYANFLKVMAAIPGFVYGNLKNSKENQTSNDDNIIVAKNIEIKRANSAVKGINRPYVLNKPLNKKKLEAQNMQSEDIKAVDRLDSNVRIENRERINNINIAKIKKQQSFFSISKDISKNKKDNKITHANQVDKIKNVKELQKTIINLIKKKLIKTVNELEILQSELYILSEVNGENRELRECQRELDQVKNILCRVDKLKEQYDFLRDNYDFEYLLEIDDENLVDKIIELKDSFDRNEVKAVTEDYKLLDVYKYLYLKIDDLQEKTNEFNDVILSEEKKLKERDIDFEKLKNDVYSVDLINLRYEQFVNNQNELLQELDQKVNNINSYEQITYRLKGFGALFLNSFKYFGLLLMSPLKGIIPSIATETIITSNIVKNLYQNLEWQETKRMVYEAVDYASMIGNAISDLESTNRIVDMTLDDLVHLKMKYNEKFKQYQGDFLEYQDIMHKISDMENKILGNKIKIEMMRQRALEQQRANNKKMILVRQLNEKEN